MSIKLKRGTRAAINAQATQGLLQQGEPLFITDESRFAVATSATQYTDMAKRDDSPILFSAFVNQITSPASNTPIVTWTTEVNLGGGVFSGTDGSYTAPKTGWYRLRLDIMQNNTSVGGGLVPRINGVNQNRLAYAANPSAGYDTASGESFYFVTAGHKVQIISENGITWYGNPAPSPVGRWVMEFKTASAT